MSKDRSLGQIFEQRLNQKIIRQGYSAFYNTYRLLIKSVVFMVYRECRKPFKRLLWDFYHRIVSFKSRY